MSVTLSAGSSGPEIACLLHEQQGFLPSIGRVFSIPPGDRIGLRPQLAGKGKSIIAAGAFAPASDAVFPPAEEEIDPGAMMRKGNLDLHLLARSDPTVEGP